MIPTSTRDQLVQIFADAVEEDPSVLLDVVTEIRERDPQYDPIDHLGGGTDQGPTTTYTTTRELALAWRGWIAAAGVFGGETPRRLDPESPPLATIESIVSVVTAAWAAAAASCEDQIWPAPIRISLDGYDARLEYGQGRTRAVLRIATGPTAQQQPNAELTICAPADDEDALRSARERQYAAEEAIGDRQPRLPSDLGVDALDSPQMRARYAAEEDRW